MPLPGFLHYAMRRKELNPAPICTFFDFLGDFSHFFPKSLMHKHQASPRNYRRTGFAVISSGVYNYFSKECGFTAIFVRDYHAFA
jgi:hypothetical protein